MDSVWKLAGSGRILPKDSYGGTHNFKRVEENKGKVKSSTEEEKDNTLECLVGIRCQQTRAASPCPPSRISEKNKGGVNKRRHAHSHHRTGGHPTIALGRWKAAHTQLTRGGD